MLVDDIARAVRASSAAKVYVCNVATQRGETDDFHVSDHLTAITDHVGHQIFDYMLVNSNLDNAIPPQLEVSAVGLNGDLSKAEAMGVKVVLSDVVDSENPLRHDPKKLAASLMRVYYDKYGKSQNVNGKASEIEQIGA